MSNSPLEAVTGARAASAARALLLGVVLVSGGCDATRATGPAEGGTPETAGPPLTPSAQVNGTLLDRTTIPPGEGSNSVSANIQLPAAGENMAVIRITGGVSVSLTAPESCQGGLAGSWGPGGAHGGPQFQVFFEVVLPNGETIMQAGGKVAGNDMETAIGTNFFPGGRITRVWRNDVNGACWIIGKTDPVPLYMIVGGTQVLTVTTLGPATVSADRRYVETRGDTVTFTAGGSGGSVSAAYWRFVAGDTLETPGASSGEWINPRCEGQTTCRWAPPVSGRMYVVGAEIDRVHWSGTAAGPVVWVGRAAPPCVEQPAAAARMSVAGTAAEAVCQEAPRLLLTCDRTTVTRGDSVECEASPVPDDARFTMTGWQFTGGGYTITPGAAGPNSAHGERGNRYISWGGPMVVSGVITATAEVNGRTVTSNTVRITVEPRQWIQSPVATPEFKTIACESRTATCPLVYPPSEQRDLGQTVSSTGVDYPLAQITAGPNESFNYVSAGASPIRVSKVTIYLSRVLSDPQDPFWRAPTNTCTFDILNAHVREHELLHVRYLREVVEGGEPAASLERQVYRTADQSEAAQWFDRFITEQIMPWVRDAGDGGENGHKNEYPANPCSTGLPRRR